MLKRHNNYQNGKSILYILIFVVVAGAFFVYHFALSGEVEYLSDTYKKDSSSNLGESGNIDDGTKTDTTKLPRVNSHLKTPEPLKGVYMTSWVAGSGDGKGGFPKREAIMDLIDQTEINAVVIDIKDDTGLISFLVDDPILKKFGTDSNRISDIENFIRELHERDIYVIGRVAVFQDPKLVALRPDLAVKSKASGGVWKDRRGLTWLDAGAKEVWEYVILIARESHRKGFDEIQFDYVRFPSDGNTADIVYPFFAGKTIEVETIVYEERLVDSEVPTSSGETKVVVRVPVTKTSTVSMTRHHQMKEFYDYVGDALLGEFPISVDLFGYTTTNTDDLGIGQIIEDAMPNFDYISPMVYPSHYNKNAFGLGDPNDNPGEVVYRAMIKGVERFKAKNENILKLRPWLQDFNYPVTYDASEVRAQIDAVYRAGLTSWILWDPGNSYTKAALKLEGSAGTESESKQEELKEITSNRNPFLFN